MDAVSQMDLVFVWTVLRLAFGLARQSDANDPVQSGLFSRGNVSQRDEPQPVGGCHEHLHPRVRVRPGEVKLLHYNISLFVSYGYTLKNNNPGNHFFNFSSKI